MKKPANGRKKLLYIIKNNNLFSIQRRNINVHCVCARSYICLNKCKRELHSSTNCITGYSQAQNLAHTHGSFIYIYKSPKYYKIPINISFSLKTHRGKRMMKVWLLFCTISFFFIFIFFNSLLYPISNKSSNSFCQNIRMYSISFAAYSLLS